MLITYTEKGKETMRKLKILMFLTLDGILQAPGGPEEDTENGFIYGGWAFGYWDSILDNVMDEQMGKSFDLLLGRKTYDIFASYWPNAKDVPGADLLNSARKHVVTRTPVRLDWNNSVPVTGNIPEEIRKLKNQEGPELQVFGSSELIQILLKNDLIDEYRLKIFPVTIGKGKRLFGEGTIPASFRLIDSRITTKGVIVADYVRDGEIKSGSFAL